MAQSPYSPPGVPVAGPSGDQSTNAFRPTVVERGLALLLVVGGALGMGMSLYMAAKLLPTLSIASILGCFLVLLFAGSIFIGVQLWRGRNRGRKGAMILFGLQIPILTVPGHSYEYYTGISVGVLGGHVDKRVSISLGANANLRMFDPQVTESAYGLNIAALAAAAYLLRRRRTV